MSENTFKLPPGAIRQSLVHALTAYDRKQPIRPGYNRFALGHYMKAIQAIMEELDAGTPPRQAITHNLCGRLLDVALKSIGEPESSMDEQRQNFRLVSA